MLAMFGMLFAVGGILWIILVVILVLLILGFVVNRRSEKFYGHRCRAVVVGVGSPANTTGRTQWLAKR